MPAPDPAPKTTTPQHTSYFTFGADHLGGRGWNRYVTVHADNYQHAREKMWERFRNAWAFQYDSDNPRSMTEARRARMIEVDFETGEDIVTLDLMREAAKLMPDGWVAEYERWLKTRRMS